MKTAKTSVTMADIDVRMLGEYGIDDALAAFDVFPWQEEVQRSKLLDAEGKDCVSPDMTFLIPPYHFTVTVHESPSVLDVELCVQKKSKLLGVIPMTSTKFFEFKKISREEFQKLLRSFFGLPENEQLAFYTGIKNA
jgi:hypothetical protein